MRRREFITLLGGTAVWPLAAHGQQQLPVIGFLRSTVASGFEHLETALRHGLDEEGFVEGRNVVIEYRYADNQRDRLPALVDDLIRRSVAVIELAEVFRRFAPPGAFSSAGRALHRLSHRDRSSNGRALRSSRRLPVRLDPHENPVAIFRLAIWKHVEYRTPNA